ncbi:MAG TPA: CaiB/BaiF CoA-transferase family protein [Actinomycetota bacterium]|nr:CaiB/BaiF CoA-transferase family protein [Actinomycetota bacterium]
MPLQGLRVLDVATVIGGPGAATRLGDFGADVIKVEHPVTGDTTRAFGWRVAGTALWWKHLSRNKRPITLRLSDRRGRDLLLRLVDTADVLIESFRPGTMERWGLGPEELLTRNPGLVMLRISGFGQTGPYARRPGFGTLAESLSGFVHMNGEADGPPLLPPIALADEVAALLGAFAVMVALHHRDRDGGSGQVIDQSLFEGLFGLTGPLALAYDRLGLVTGRHGGRLPYVAPRNSYRTSDDRWVAVSGTSQSVADRIFAAIERPELAGDPRFATNEARLDHVEELDAILSEWIGAHTLQEVMAAFESHEAAASPIYDVQQIFADMQYRARGTMVRVEDEELGDVILPEVQPRLSATPGRHRHAGLSLGSANREVFVDELGLSDDELERLRTEGVV